MVLDGDVMLFFFFFFFGGGGGGGGGGSLTSCNFGKELTLIRLRVLRRLIWIYTVCKCPSPGL